jgi:IS605 OrfB family transposase
MKTKAKKKKKIPKMCRAISMEISVPENFLSFLETCNEIYNIFVDWAFEKNCYNKFKADKALYHELRLQFPEIPSALLQSIRDSAMGAVKATEFKFKPKKKPHGQVCYDLRTSKLKDNVFNFTHFLGEKRFQQIINIPKFFTDRYSNWKFASATIGYNKKKKKFLASLIFTQAKPEVKQKEEKAVVGIDRGLYNIVSLSDGTNYHANKIREVQRRMLFLKKQLQRIGTRPARRKLQKLSGYEKRYTLNYNHIISKEVVNLPFDVFVLEDLTGIARGKRKGKVLNKWLSSWAFYQLEQLIKYKAELLGKEVVMADARYTSQKCSNCSYTEKANRKGSHFCCLRCGYENHSDLNAAINIKNCYASLLLLKQEKAKQAESQPAKCLDIMDSSGTSHQPRADGS